MLVKWGRRGRDGSLRVIGLNWFDLDSDWLGHVDSLRPRPPPPPPHPSFLPSPLLSSL